MNTDPLAFVVRDLIHPAGGVDRAGWILIERSQLGIDTEVTFGTSIGRDESEIGLIDAWTIVTFIFLQGGYRI